MNVMFLGDTHGSKYWTRRAITWAAENGIDRLVQVGDFGFWPRTNNGQDFLKETGKASQKAGVPLYFIDGNHEDHLYLDSMRVRVEDNGGFITYGKYPITYIDRGTRWGWGGTWFGAFGGAYSIDRSRRVLESGRYGWFRNETPDESKITDLGKVDVLITHDSPIIPPSVYGMGHFKTDETSRESQAAVYRALVSTEAKLLIHGHWHLNERYAVNGATVQGLNCDDSGLHSMAVVFSTSNKTLYKISEWEYRNV